MRASFAAMALIAIGAPTTLPDRSCFAARWWPPSSKHTDRIIGGLRLRLTGRLVRPAAHQTSTAHPQFRPQACFQPARQRAFRRRFVHPFHEPGTRSAFRHRVSTIPIEPLRNNSVQLTGFSANFCPIKGRIKWRVWFVSDTSSGISIRERMSERKRMRSASREVGSE